jgi:lipopolysaccharide biosynthesis regulator YciM
MKEVHGPDQPHTLHTIHNYALIYEDQGDDDKAIQLLADTFEKKQVALGLRSQATLKTALTLGRLYRKNQRFDEAEELAHKIREGLEFARGAV